MADALANVIAVFPSTDSARWIVARLPPAPPPFSSMNSTPPNGHQEPETY